MPVVIDLFCGLGGWSKGFLSEGWDAVGFDIERHRYGDKRYPGQLVLQDVLTLHGSQFRHADAIVASPPCQRYSYMAMAWTRAKEQAAAIRADTSGLMLADLNALFLACFRLQREASEAAGRYIPMVVENVKGAQPWVGSAKWHYGSYYLWGDVPALMPSTLRIKRPGRNFHAFENGLGSSPSFNGGEHETRGLKTVGHANIRDGHTHTRHLTNQRESAGLKGPGGDWFANGRQGQDACADGIKQAGLSGPEWFNGGAASVSSSSDARKAASAQIAEIPFDLAQWIAKCFKPAMPPGRLEVVDLGTCTAFAASAWLRLLR